MEHKVITIIALTLLAGAAVYMQQTNGPMTLEQQFANWQSLNGKHYSAAEQIHRFAIFTQNYLLVEAHNARYEAGLETFAIGMNMFADLTNEEYRAKYLTLTQKPTSGRIYQAKGIKYPDSVDWTSSLKLQVKNQGSCGSCWAFSAVAAAEGHFAQSGKFLDLSEQELVDCANAENEGYESDGCNGGWMSEGLDYIAKRGVAIASEYPYKGVDQTCQRSATKTRYQTGGYTDVAANNSAAFHEAVAKKPVSVAINAGGIWFQLYTKGIFSKACKGGVDDLNHGVLAAGYTPEYYNVKNSWGSSWGEAGYIRFAILSTPEGQCGIHQLPSFPI